MPERSAIVTGSSRGIGRAIADALAQDGYSLTITGRRPDGVEQAVSELQEAGADVHGVALNHTDPDAPAEIVKRHAERFGRLDVLVNNAGVGIGAAADEHQTKFVDMQLDVNVRAIILFYREAIPLLKAAAAETGQSHVINLSSISGKSGQPWLSVYSATKAAVVGYTEAMSKELASARHQVDRVLPRVRRHRHGGVRQGADPGRGDDPAAGHRRGRPLRPAAVARLHDPEIVFMRPGETAGLV